MRWRYYHARTVLRNYTGKALMSFQDEQMNEGIELLATSSSYEIVKKFKRSVAYTLSTRPAEPTFNSTLSYVVICCKRVASRMVCQEFTVLLKCTFSGAPHWLDRIGGTIFLNYAASNGIPNECHPAPSALLRTQCYRYHGIVKMDSVQAQYMRINQFLMCLIGQWPYQEKLEKVLIQIFFVPAVFSQAVLQVNSGGL